MQIYLRPITKEDTNLIVKWRNSPKVSSHCLNKEAAEKSTVYLIGILILALKMALYQFFKFKSL